MLKDKIDSEVKDYLDYFEAESQRDPFDYLLSTRDVKKKKFVLEAKKAGLNSIAIQVGLNIINSDKLVGNKKYRWTTEEILDQLKHGALISNVSRDEYFNLKDPTDKQITYAGKKIFDELVNNLSETKKTKDEMIKEKMPKGTSTFVHEIDRKKLSNVKNLITKAWGFYNFAAEKGGYEGDLKTENIKTLIQSLEKELILINSDFEIAGLEETIEELKDIVKEGYLWEEPEHDINNLTDLKAYFSQLEKSRMKQKGMIAQYKKKQPEYKKTKALKSEGKEVNELIRNAAEDLARGKLRGTTELGLTESIKILNHTAEELANSKLSTGRTLDEYLTKAEKWDDVVSNLVPELIRQIKERRGKTKV